MSATHTDAHTIIPYCILLISNPYCSRFSCTFLVLLRVHVRLWSHPLTAVTWCRETPFTSLHDTVPSIWFCSSYFKIKLLPSHAHHQINREHDIPDVGTSMKLGVDDLPRARGRAWEKEVRKIRYVKWVIEQFSKILEQFSKIWTLSF